MTNDERSIRDLVDTWMTASKDGDIQTVLSLMTDDVIFMVPGQKPFGKEAFAAASEGTKGVQLDGRSESLYRNTWTRSRRLLRQFQEKECPETRHRTQLLSSLQVVTT